MAKIDLTNGAAPATPSAGKVSLYTKTDKKIYIKDDAGVETPLIDAGLASITALTGDVTATGPGAVPATLATVNAGVGSFTNASVTVNAKGLVTAASSGAAPITDHTGLTSIGINTHLQIDTHIGSTSNPHSVTKTQVGLGNVDNTSDVNKPVSTATQTALDGKVDENAPIAGATKTKITYDAKGLVTSGADAAIADIAGLATAIAGLVPYTGATADVDIGSNKYIGLTGTFQFLENSFGDTVFELDSRQAFDSTFVLSADLQARSLYRADGVEAFNWTNGPYIRLDPTPNTSSIFFEGGTTPYFEYSPVLDRMTTGNYTTFRFNNPQVSFDTVIDSLDLKAIEANTSFRWLYDFGGSYPSVDYGNYTLLNIGISNTVPMLDWGLAAGGGVKIYQGQYNVCVGDFTNLQLLDLNGNLIVDWLNYYLYDNFNSVSVDFNFHTLQYLGDIKLNWELGLLQTGGSTQLDWIGGTLQNAGQTVLSWASNALIDTTSVHALRWETRRLVSSLNIENLNWESTYVQIKDRMGISNTNISPTNALQIDLGNATASALKFTAGATTGQTVSDGFDVGISATGVGEIRQRENLSLELYTNNTLRAQWSGSGNLFLDGSTQARGGAGSAAVPFWGFTSSSDCGMFRGTGSTVGLSTTGTQRLLISSAGSWDFTNSTQFLTPTGSVGTPMYSFAGDSNTGMYNVGADQIGFAGGGVVRFQIFTAGVESAAQVRGAAGSAGTPTFVPSNDTNTGMFGAGADILGFSTAGTERLRIDAAGKTTIFQGTALRGAMATVYSQINSVGNVGVGEDTLHTVTTASGAFAANGDSFEVVCSGTFAANANNKRVRLKFGAITLFDTTALAFNTGDWEIKARIFRTTTTTGRSIVTWTCSNATLTTTCDYQAWAFNFLTTNALFVTGEATNDNDIVQELMQVFWVPVA
jgi:hypothetical protein